MNYRFRFVCMGKESRVIFKVVLLDVGFIGNVEGFVNLDSKLCSIWDYM